MASTSVSTPSAASQSPAPRRFGRFSLVRLLGRSVRTMAWQVSEADRGPDLVLLLPRVVPQGEGNVERWAQRARKAARLDHPNLAPVLEIGLHEGWPFALYELGDHGTLSDRIGSKGLPPSESAALAGQILHGLAFVHDAGAVHRDLQSFAVLVSDRGVARVMGAEVACIESAPNGEIDTQSLHAQRAAARDDVLQVGLLMHHLLTGQPALGDADTARVAERLPPTGREIVRLPFATPWPIPEPLRVIVNRATDRQQRQRYHSARTLARALEGWLQSDESNQGGPLAMLQDRLRSLGVLPSSPGGAERAARLALMEQGRNDELAEVLLGDVALSFELLRAVNTAQVRGAQLSGSGPVLTIRRAIAMIGLDGVRRVALTLRPWPGPLSPLHAGELERVLERVRRAARVAVSIRPRGYDAEVVYLITLLQNLGRLVVQYHFADEALQIHKLRQPAPPLQPGDPEEPGMSEQAASMAVLGVDLDAIGNAVARWWGLDDSVLHMMRRVSPGVTVHHPERDDDVLRLTASCANDAVEAAALPAHRVHGALQGVVQRYGRVLELALRDLQAALQLVPPAEAATASGVPATAVAASEPKDLP
jgi:non-specific serine/threonine protein kinase